MKKRNKVIIVVIFAILIIAMAAVAVIFGIKRPNEGTKSFTLEIVSERDGFDETTECVSELDYLGEYLRTLEDIEYEDGPYGIYIKSIYSMSEDIDNQYWWCLYVDDMMATDGADAMPITDGAHYVISLNEGW